MVREDEVARLIAVRPGSTVTWCPDGTAVVVVPDVQLPTGWSRASVTVRWVLSPIYPAAQPDCFFTDIDLRLSSGAMPANTGFQPLNGESLLWFSWHLQTWRPASDTLVTYMRSIESRLSDVR